MTEYQLLSSAYFAGTISREDELRLFHWLREDAQHEALWREWEQDWVARNADAPSTTAAWLRLQQKAAPRRIIRLRTFYRAAAACVLVAVLSVVAVTLSRRWAEPSSSMQTEWAMADSIQSLTLPDGSQVVLNQASSIRYAYASEGVRTIYLIGEAYFDVIKDPAHPFVVHADGVEIEVTGTHFNVSAYPEDAQCRTTLLEGSVTVSNALFTSDLVPGEQLTYTSSTGAIIKDKCDAESAIAWIDGRIDYNHIQMGELMGRLSRLYGKDIVLANDDAKLLDVHFVMNDTLPLSDIIQAMATTYHLSVKTTPTGYIIN